MSQPTVSLLLGVHNHQPVDNWDHVIQEATEKCYQPFLEVLDQHPRVKMSVHYTGYLLEWLAAHYPQLIALLRKLVERGQVEVFTGGMYEPILSIIPDVDKLGQIQKLSKRIQALLGTTPKGMWLAERVWEPHLVQYLAEAGVQYVCLDDSHFKSVGLDEAELLGRYTSEEQGRMVDIFPISKQMRYLIPYADPGQIMDYLRTIATPEGNRAAIYFDDGEKFGVWPGTYKAVFTDKWLERFFSAIEANQDVVKCQLYSEYVSQTRSFGRIYLPTASYSEMLAWALPAKYVNPLENALHHAPPEYERFLRGGFWRHFLVKYPESNNLHKKMLRVSQKVRHLDPAKSQKALEALDHLWQGQSNDAFWHGVFGGLYLTNLRTATYKHLLMAENLADAARQGNVFFNIETSDFDCDGQPEVLIETPYQNLYLDPQEGGGLFELDYRPKAFNLLDTLSRRYEPYHDKLADAVIDDGSAGEAKTIHDRVVTKEKGLERLLHYDWYRRMSLLDHFLAENTTLDTLYEMRYGEEGDFINQPYTLSKAAGNEVILERLGQVWIQGTAYPIHVQKKLTVAKDSAETRIEYRMTNRSEDTATLWFAPEFNVNLLAPDAPDRYYRVLATEPSKKAPAKPEDGGVALAERTETLTDTRMVSKGVLEGIPGIALVDDWMGLTYQLVFDRPTTLWRFPIETVSQSEAGFERVYQSSALFPNWKLSLAPGQTETLVLVQRILSQR